MFTRRTVLGSVLAVASVGMAAASVPTYRVRSALQILADRHPSSPAVQYASFAQPEAWAAILVRASERQIGETVIYDPSYVRLPYPGGDVPRDRGVCTDVVIRAYRDAFGVDLQRLVHEDMRRNFSAYPDHWGMKHPDRNIDHRRVYNLAAFFERSGAARPVTNEAEDYRPGDMVAQKLPGNRPHIAIVGDRANAQGNRPLVIHNIGAGARLEDSLFEFEITGHYRYRPRKSALLKRELGSLT